MGPPTCSAAENGPDLTLGEASHCPVAKQTNHSASLPRTALGGRAAARLRRGCPSPAVPGEGCVSEPGRTAGGLRAHRPGPPLSRGPMGSPLD